MHNEAKQTVKSEFGTEKGLLHGQARRMGGLCSKNPKLPRVFREKFLYVKFGVRAAGHLAFF